MADNNFMMNPWIQMGLSTLANSGPGTSPLQSIGAGMLGGISNIQQLQMRQQEMEALKRKEQLQKQQLALQLQAQANLQGYRNSQIDFNRDKFEYKKGQDAIDTDYRNQTLIMNQAKLGLNQAKLDYKREMLEKRLSVMGTPTATYKQNSEGMGTTEKPYMDENGITQWDIQDVPPETQAVTPETNLDTQIQIMEDKLNFSPFLEEQDITVIQGKLKRLREDRENLKDEIQPGQVMSTNRFHEEYNLEDYTPESVAVASRNNDPKKLQKIPENLSRKQVIDTQLRFDVKKDYFVSASNTFRELDELIADRGPMQDVTILYRFIKALDPPSVVREGETALVNSASTITGILQGWIDKLGQGGFIGTVERKSMQDTLKLMRESYKKEYDIFAKRASRYEKQFPELKGLNPPKVEWPSFDRAVPEDTISSITGSIKENGFRGTVRDIGHNTGETISGFFGDMYDGVFNSPEPTPQEVNDMVIELERLE